MATFKVLDELMEITSLTKLHKCMRFWFVQEIAKEEGFAKFLRDRYDDLRRRINKRRVLISEMEAFEFVEWLLIAWSAGIHEKKGHVARMDLNE
ncbi:hypothetical protein Tco_0808144 [Tanacetum coccineum]